MATTSSLGGEPLRRSIAGIASGSTLPGSRAGSEVFEPVAHLFGGVELPDQHEPPDDFPEGVPTLVAVDDPGMIGPRLVDADEIPVVGEEGPAFGMGMAELLFIRGPEETDLLRGRRVNPPGPEGAAQPRVATLGEVEPDRVHS